jgi:hypothetical protein
MSAAFDHTRVRVGVLPAAEHAARARLFAALERVYGVRFEPRSPGKVDGLDALVCIGEGAADVQASLPRLVAISAEGEPGRALPVDYANVAALDGALRGARVHESAVAPIAAVAGATVLASIDGAPVWTLAGETQVVAAAPDELGSEELLRERLLPGRHLALLALAHFLRELTASNKRSRDAERSVLRAAFVLDDPNLHWPTYGHLRYRELLAHAQTHNYHLAVAMIPLDAWLVHPTTARMFREGRDRLSVLVHGNDHDGGELGRIGSTAEGVALAAQALRRMDRFEARSGVPVARVMVPPHERVTEGALAGLLACGYDAVCTARPFPWVPADGPSWLIHPPGTDPTACWTPGHSVAGGMPIVMRQDFGHPHEELILRAFLGQPLVIYGHHTDLAGGLDVLAEAAAAVNRLGDVRWCALDEIARASAPQPRTRVRLPNGARRRPRLRPLARRIATEGRDRLRAVV